MKPTAPPKDLLSTPLWRGSSYDTGESSIVLWDKSRLAQPTRRLAQLHRPAIADGLYQQIFGDKEVYWIACVLGGSAAVLSEYGYAAAGSPIACGSACVNDDSKVHDCVQPYAFVLAQYLAAPQGSGSNANSNANSSANRNANRNANAASASPAVLSHLNGEGVLLAMALGPAFVEEKLAQVSPPTLYGDSSQLGTCQPARGDARSLSAQQMTVIKYYHAYWRRTFSVLPAEGGTAAAVEVAKRKVRTCLSAPNGYPHTLGLPSRVPTTPITHTTHTTQRAPPRPRLRRKVFKPLLRNYPFIFRPLHHPGHRR